jgi:hypothetical protein
MWVGRSRKEGIYHAISLVHRFISEEALKDER